MRDLRAGQRARRTEKIRRLVLDAKTGGCVDCGRTDLPVEVLDLDHVHGERCFSLSHATQHGIAAVEAELAKCEARCPTCHALRHYRERTNDHGRNH